MQALRKIMQRSFLYKTWCSGWCATFPNPNNRATTGCDKNRSCAQVA